MSAIQGTNVAAGIAPFDSDDAFPTHFAQYGKGGWRSVATYADLANITINRKEAGMSVYVIDEGKIYIWNATSEMWDEYKTGGIVALPAITPSGYYTTPDSQEVDFRSVQQSILQIGYNKQISADSILTACVLACTNLINLPETGELVLIIDNNATKADTVAEGEAQTYTGVPLNVTLPTTLTGYTIVNMANLTTIAVAYRKSLEVHFLIINNTVRITLISQG